MRSHPLVVGTLIVVSAAALALTSLSTGAVGTQTPPVVVQPPVSLLVRLGLDPDALAAAGLSPAGATAVVTAARQHLTDHGAALAAADSAVAAAQGGNAAVLETKVIARDQLLNAAFAATTANLTAEQRALLQRVRSNREWALPVEFLVVERTAEDWVALRDAYIDVQRAQTSGRPASPESIARVNQAQANSSVIAAKAAMAVHGSSVQSAWLAAIAQ